MKRVVVTGMGGFSPIGHDWKTLRQNLQSVNTAVRTMPEWDIYPEMDTRLAAPIGDFEKPSHYSRKMTRSMGRVALMATAATERALKDAGLLGDPCIQDGRMGVSYGSSSGSSASIAEFGNMLLNQNSGNLNANSYLKMMSHTAAVNIGVFFGLKGRVITTSSACTSGSQGIGYAYEAIQAGKQIIARQQLVPVYHRNGVAYAIKRKCLLDQKSIKGERTGALVLEGNLVSIDTYWDLDLSEYIRTKGQG